MCMARVCTIGFCVCIVFSKNKVFVQYCTAVTSQPSYDGHKLERVTIMVIRPANKRDDASHLLMAMRLTRVSQERDVKQIEWRLFMFVRYQGCARGKQSEPKWSVYVSTNCAKPSSQSHVVTVIQYPSIKH